MEIEFIFAAPPGAGTAGFERIEIFRDAVKGGPAQVLPAPEQITGYWFERFGVVRQSDWPVAPWRLAPDQAGNAFWLCADPIHLQLDHDRLLFDPGSPDDLSAADAQGLIAELNPHLAVEGMQLLAVTPARWVLRLPRALEVAVPAPGLAAGMPAAMTLPRGADAAQVRRWSSELQMLLHQAGTNAERENLRRWPINSLWLWGGGVRPAADDRAAARQMGGQIVFSAQNHVRELCRTAGGQGLDLPLSWQQTWPVLQSMHCDKALIDMTEITWKEDWEAVLQTNWLTPAALLARKQNLTFWAVFSGPAQNLRLRLYRRDLFHFFRRKSLAQYLDKSQNQGNS